MKILIIMAYVLVSYSLQLAYYPSEGGWLQYCASRWLQC